MTTDRASPTPLTVAVVTLGCARNEVDSEELAGRLEAGGFVLVDDPEDADTVVVNTCGFVEAAKKDSVDTLLEAADLKESPAGTRRPSSPSAAWPSATARTSPSSLPEADAVLGFDDYPDIAARLRSIVAGEAHHAAHAAGPPPAAADLAGRARRLAISVPGHAGPARRRRHRCRCARDRAPRRTPPPRRRPDGPAQAGQRLRPALLVLRDPELPRLVREPPAQRRAGRGAAGWPTQGVRELFLVSENSTSYGKDLGDLRLLETLLPELAAIDGVERVRVSYLQPAETRPGPDRGDRRRRRAWCPTSTCPSSTPAPRCCAGCAASATPTASSACSTRSASWRPLAGVRSNVIVGFPGETEDDLADPVRLPRSPRGWTSRASSATPTRTAPRPRSYDGKLDEDEVRARTEHVTALVEELNAQRAEERIGESVVGARRVARRTATSRAGPRTRAPRSTARRLLDRRRRRAASATS